MKLLRTNARLHGQHLSLLPALYIACATLDVIEFFGMQTSPLAFGQIGCMVHPLAALATPIVPQALLDFVATQCTRDPSSAAVSIIFLMVKMSLGILAVPTMIVMVTMRPDSYLRIRNTAFEELRNKDYPRQWKDHVIGFPVVCAFTIGFWWASVWQYPGVWQAPERFNTRLLHKLSYEDFFCCSILVSAVFVLLAVSYFLIWPLNYRFRETSVRDKNDELRGDF